MCITATPRECVLLAPKVKVPTMLPPAPTGGRKLSLFRVLAPLRFLVPVAEAPCVVPVSIPGLVPVVLMESA